MQAAFGRGTLYTPDGNQMLADVYYFIQPRGCTTNSIGQLQGFLDPILEYRTLTKILAHSKDFVIELDDGTKVRITSDTCNENSECIPIFFSASSSEVSLSLPSDGASPSKKHL